MSNDSFGDAPENRFLGQPDTPVTTVPDSFSPNLLENPRVATLSRQIGRLYGWLGLLTGLSVLSIGLLAGYAYWLKMQQDQMQQQLSAVNGYKAEIERLKSLESRINNLDSQSKILNQNVELLNQQVSKGLPTQIKGVQNDLSSVKASLQTMRASLQRAESNAAPREQFSQPLQRAPLEPSRPVAPIAPGTPVLPRR